jgi:diguanylate cyclase (GGDEF)-like protein
VILLKQIGQFAKDNNVTVKTLYHYEKLGLLMPKHIDEETGYRYYSDDQSQDLKVVIFLKDLGLSLSEINDVLNHNYSKKAFVDFLVFKKNQAHNDYENTSNRLFKLDKIINHMNDKSTSRLNIKELIGMSEKELFTGVYGRSKFIEEAENRFNKAKKENKPFCVMELDLDYFKNVNDQYGYEVGDIVIKRTQDEIVSHLQKTDYFTMIERRGGDEFTIVLETKIMEASKLATKILNAVVGIDYSDVADDKLRVSITAGIAKLTKGTKIYQDLVNDASIALYQNKRRNRKH